MGIPSHKATLLDDQLDQGWNCPLFVRFQTSDGGAPAPLAPTHYREAMGVVVQAESAVEEHRYALGGGQFVTFSNSPGPTTLFQRVINTM